MKILHNFMSYNFTLLEIIGFYLLIKTIIIVKNVLNIYIHKC